MSKILLSANHIVHSFGERKILEFEKLTVYEGDRIGIVGTNGAGKTTLLNILSGELAPEEGSVTRKAPVSYFRQFRQRAEQADPQKCSEFGLSGKLCRERLLFWSLPMNPPPIWMPTGWSSAAGCWNSARPCCSSAMTGLFWTACAPASSR